MKLLSQETVTIAYLRTCAVRDPEKLLPAALAEAEALVTELNLDEDDTPPQDDSPTAELTVELTEKQRDLLQVILTLKAQLETDEVIELKDIAEASGKAAGLLRPQVQELVDAGLLTEGKNGRAKTYTPTIDALPE